MPTVVDPTELAALRALAETAARAGGAVARDFFRRQFRVTLKADRTEVSDADHAAQVAVVAAVAAVRPNDAFVTEEPLQLGPGMHPPPPAGDDALCWIIDPLDGTRNFVRGIPVYTCSVGVMLGGCPIVGAVYEPERDEMYSAHLGGVLFVNGQPWPRQRPAGLSSKLLVGVPAAPKGTLTEIAHRWLDRFVGRNFGSCALHLAQVAAGQLDGMLSDNARLWDLAAGWVLVSASGGRITTPNGQPLFPANVSSSADSELPFIAGHGGVFDELLAV